MRRLRRRPGHSDAPDDPLADRFQREEFEARLREFHDKIDPVLQLLGSKSPLVSVDARADRETVTRDIRAGLGLPAA